MILVIQGRIADRHRVTTRRNEAKVRAWIRKNFGPVEIAPVWDEDDIHLTLYWASRRAKPAFSSSSRRDRTKGDHGLVQDLAYQMNLEGKPYDVEPHEKVVSFASQVRASEYYAKYGSAATKRKLDVLYRQRQAKRQSRSQTKKRSRR